MLKECKVLFGLTLTVFLFFFTGCGDMFDFSTETPATPATPDTTKPSVTSQSPSSGATGVAVNTTVSASISDPSGVYYDGFSLSAGSCSVERAPDETGLTFTPKHRLDYSTQHTATISNVRDGAGNTLGNVSWSFTTALPLLNVHITPDSHNLDVGKYNSIAISPDGESYITYMNSSDCSLRIISTTTNGTSFIPTLEGWKIDGPPGAVSCAGKDSSFKIDSAGNFHVVYLRNRTGTDAVGTGNGVTLQFPKPLTYKPIKKGTVKILHNVTQIGQDDGNGKISGTNIDSNNSTIDYLGGNLVLRYTVPPGNGVAITTTYTPTDEVTYAYATPSNVTSGPWQITPIYKFNDTTGADIDADIDTDGNNKAHVSFYDPENTALRYTTNKNGSWPQQPDIVDTGAVVDNPGKYSSIKVDGNNTVHISYADYHSQQDNYNLKYARGKYGGPWTGINPGTVPDVLDSTGNVGMHSSLVLDGGNIYITYNDLYNDLTNGRIKMVEYENNMWSESVVVTGLPTGWSGETTCPLFIESNGIMHMSYISNVSPGKLYYLYYVSKAWEDCSWSTPTVVDSGIGNGIYTSIAVDSNGKDIVPSFS